MRYLPFTLFVAFIIGIGYGLIKHDQPANDPNTPTVEEVYDTPTESPVQGEKPERPADSALFIKGQKVTCIMDGIFSWDNGDEFVKSIPVKCTVLDTSEPIDYSSYGQASNYQQIQVDCTADINKKTGGPGSGLVKNHKLNVKIRWTTSDACYHFQNEYD